MMQRLPRPARLTILAVACVVFLAGVGSGVLGVVERRAAAERDRAARDFAIQLVAHEAEERAGILCARDERFAKVLPLIVRAMGEGLGAQAAASARSEGATPAELAELAERVEVYIEDQVVRVKAVLPETTCPAPTPAPVAP